MNAEGVRKIKPRATPWERSGRFRTSTLKAFVNVTCEILNTMNGVGRTALRTLSEFSAQNSSVYPGRCPGLEIANAFGVIHAL